MILPALLAALTVGIVLAAPKSVRTPRWTFGVLWVGVCACAVLLSRGLLGAALGSAAALAPFAANVFRHGSLLPLVLLLNAHPLALLASRLLEAQTPAAAAAARPWVVAAALLAAAVSALCAHRETDPRRVLTRLMTGQGALILAGLSCGNAAAAAGALALWMTAAVASTMLACVYAGLEARIGPALDRPGFLGLAASAPRLAVFFAVAAFALGDLPLTMGFPAAELLLRGLLEAGLAGLALPAVAALNAFVILRLFARLFWGPPLDVARDMPDALPRERWVLSAGLLFLLYGGLFPSTLLP